MFSKVQQYVALFLALIAVGTASLAYAGTLSKTLGSPFTAPAGSYAVALSGNVAASTNMFCQTCGGCCLAVSVAVTLKDAEQSQLSPKVYVQGYLVTLDPPTTLADGSRKWTGGIKAKVTPTPYPVRLELQSNSGAAIVVDPGAGDFLRLEANTAA